MSGYIETFESANDLYLQHEKTWGKHKYISRTKKGGRWVYSYPKSKADIPTNSDIENLAGIDSTDPADAAVLKQYKDYFNSSEYQNSPHKAIKDLSFDEQNDLIKKVSAYKDKNLQAIQKYASGSGESRLKKLLASSAKHSAFSNGYIETFESVDDSYLEHFGIRGMHWGSRKAKTVSTKNRTRIVGYKGDKAYLQKTKSNLVRSARAANDSGSYGARYLRAGANIVAGIAVHKVANKIISDPATSNGKKWAAAIIGGLIAGNRIGTGIAGALNAAGDQAMEKQKAKKK